MSSQLEIVTASTPEHFAHMSLLHALGWRDTYKGYVPDDYMAREITDARWVPYFQRAYETGESTGLLAYVQGRPVSCLNYGPARTDNYNAGTVCTFPNAGYEDWGEIISFYSHPAERGKGYGGLLFEAALDRLRRDGFQRAFVFVLRENQGARRFYAAHGFAWDGTRAEIPFPPDAICVDLRYVRDL